MACEKMELKNRFQNLKEKFEMKLNKAELGLGGGSLLQVAQRSPIQMMSYLIDTPEGKLIIIDGGDYGKEDADNLHELIMQRGGHVDLWIISHAHKDHFGALTWMMEHYPVFDITIDRMCFHFPAKEWLAQMEEWDYNQLFTKNLEKHGIRVETPIAGDVYECGSILVEIVSVPEDYEGYHQINSTSMITLVHFPKQDVLFLGDFDVYAQEEFLKKHEVSKIRKDIVQMAHHGQNAVDRSFYELIQPKVCLYPTPKWLWENNLYACNDPETVGKGPFTTLETRRWMEELGAEQSFTQEAGDWLFI